MLDRRKFYPGLILHVRSYKIMSIMIRKVLSFQAKKEGQQLCWGNHDGILGLVDGVWCIGESVFPRSRWLPISDLEKMKCEIQAYCVMDTTVMQHKMAAQYWGENLLNKKYDWVAFPRLFLKSTVMDIFDTDCGMEWAWWCTESIAEAFKKGPGIDVWRKRNPTPYTTERRVGVTLARYDIT